MKIFNNESIDWLLCGNPNNNNGISLKLDQILNVNSYNLLSNINLNQILDTNSYNRYINNIFLNLNQILDINSHYLLLNISYKYNKYINDISLNPNQISDIDSFNLLLDGSYKYNETINEYISNESVDWFDPNNWSLNRIPNNNDTVLIVNKIVVSFGYSNVLIKNLIIRSNGILIIYNYLKIIKNMTITNSCFLLFNNLLLNNLKTNNAVIWLIDNPILYTNTDIHVNNGDILIVNNSSTSYIIHNTLHNNGIISMLQSSNLIILGSNYYQYISGKTIIYYRSSSTIGSIIAKNISILGILEIIDDHMGDNYVENNKIICTPIYIGNIIDFNATIINKTNKRENIIVSNNNITICFT